MFPTDVGLWNGTSVGTLTDFPSRCVKRGFGNGDDHSFSDIVSIILEID